MHYRNSPKDRNSNWAVAVAPSRDNVKIAHRWCHNQESIGGFYHHYTNTRWWFEYKEDAIVFALKFSGI